MSTLLKSLVIVLYSIVCFSGVVEAIPSVAIGEKDISTHTYHTYEFHEVKISDGDTIRLEFLNNLFEGAGQDRNVYVDYIEIDDLAGTVIRVEAEDSTVDKTFSDHVISDLEASGSLSYAMLNDDERLSFRFTSSRGSNGVYSMRIRARGDQYKGPPVLNARVDSDEFVNELLVSGLVQPTSMAFLPDGHLLILEQCGKVLVVDPNDTSPHVSTYMDLTPVTGCVNEQGAIDLTLDPDFATNQYLYISYLHAPSSRFRIARFTHPGGHGGDVSSEVLIWQTSNNSMISHLGGGLDFGPDGKLYLTTGDGGAPSESQDLFSHLGKVIRLNKDGSIPTDNPFVDLPGGARDEIWALGLRNPFRARWDLSTNRFFISDVGGNDQQKAWEDVHLGGASKNFGWPLCEGPCDNPDIPSCSCNDHDDPIFGYPHMGSGASVIGGVVYRGHQFPSQYVGAYFYGDFVRQFIRYVTFDSTGLSVAGDFDFDPDAGWVVSIEEGPDGALYYLDIVSGSLHRISLNQGSPVILQAHAHVSTGLAPLTVNFTGMATDHESDPLIYTWNFGDGEKMIGENASHTYPFNGTFTASLEVSDGINVTKSKPIVILVGAAPQATITSPVNGSRFRAGDVIQYTGTAVDSDETLQDENFGWTVDFGHNEHTHPELAKVAGMSGTFVIPASGHDFHDSTSYIFTLTVTDSDGLRGTKSVEIFPDKVDVVFGTNPPRMNLTLDQIPKVTPFMHDTLVGFHHTIEAPLNQCKEGISYDFHSWSDGVVSALRTITVPTRNHTLTAKYRAVGFCPLEELVIENMMVRSRNVYPTFKLNSGERMYTDRSFTFVGPIPSILKGHQTIRTANNDKFSSPGDTSFLQFTVNQGVEVYVLYTNVNTTLETEWLHEGQGWELQEVTVPTSLPNAEGMRLVRKKSFPAGLITLPGNGSQASQSSMYHVVVVPRGPGNQAPIAVNDVGTTTVNTPLEIAVLANDTDLEGEALTLHSVTPPSHGVATMSIGNTIQYVPDVGFTGEDTFTYTIRDAQGAQATATVTVIVDLVSQGPLIDNLTVGSGESYEIFTFNSGAKMYTDRSYTFGASLPAALQGQQAIRPANDDKFSRTSDGAFLHFDVSQAVEVYVLYTNVNTTLETEWLHEGQGWELQEVTVPTSLPNAERLRLVRKKSFPAGLITLPGNGSQASQSSMYHVVVVPRGPGNQAPIAVNDVGTTTVNTPLEIAVLANDTDLEGEALTLHSVTPPSHGMATMSIGNTIQYVPDVGFTGEDTFTYTIRDAQGAQATATVTVIVDLVSQGPLIDNLTVGSGESYEIFTFNSGAKMYTDRSYTFGASLPAALQGQQAIRPANDDKFSRTSDGAFLHFDVSQAVEVYVLYTNVNTTLETEWLHEGQGWELQEVTVPTSLPNAERLRLVRKKSFPAGLITLPGNGSQASQSSMYHVVVVPE